MRKAIKFPKNYIKRNYFLKILLKFLKGVWKEGTINKREAEVNVGLPPLERRIVNFSECLNLLVVFLDSEGKSSISDKFDSRFHKTIIFLL